MSTESEQRKIRGKWGKDVEFLLACLGYCVGLGNVWRFPYLCYQSGGGAFLIPYVVVLLISGIPLFFMEGAFGQFSGTGVMTVWRSLPIAKGIGIGMVTANIWYCIYYIVIMAWALFYMFASMQTTLPWTQCDQWWNGASSCVYANGTKFETPETSLDLQSNQNCTEIKLARELLANSTNTSFVLSSTAEDYWFNRVLRLNKSTGPEDPGEVLWDLCLCLLLAWILIFACLAKGVKTTGKVVYFTVIFPYLILIVLLIRGVTLDGAADGINFYMSADWDRLLDIKVWADAANQIFFSLGVAFGGVLTFATYNRFENNILRDTLIVTIGNCLTSIFAGFAIFSVIGHMAKVLCVPVTEVISQGPGLAFIAYPKALSLLPAPQLWAILFFFMLLLLGVDSLFLGVETVTTGIMDQFPNTFLTMYKFGRMKVSGKFLLLLGYSIFCFLMGILLVTEGGLHWFNLYNNYSLYYGLFLLSICMVLSIQWIYGFAATYKWRFCKDIKLMLGSEPNWYFKICWCLLSPAFTIAITINALIGYAPSEPYWYDTLGMCLSFSVIAPVPLWALWKIIQAYRNGDSIKELFKPTSAWGPDNKMLQYHHLHGNLGQAVSGAINDAFEKSTV